MKLNPISVGVCALAIALSSNFAWAQASGESAETGPPGPGDRPTAAVRSPLWQAIEAHYRQREAAPIVPDRRLTSEQRQELRDQVRRTSARHELAGQPGVERAAQR